MGVQQVEPKPDSAYFKNKQIIVIKALTSAYFHTLLAWHGKKCLISSFRPSAFMMSSKVLYILMQSSLLCM